MALYVICRIVDILSIVILVTDVINIITQQETSTDIVATFIAVLWSTINSIHISLGLFVLNIVLLFWYAYRVWLLILTYAMCKEQSQVARPFSLVLLTACKDTSEQLAPIETEFLAKHTWRLYDNVKVTFNVYDLLALTNMTCAGEWNIAGLDGRPYTVTATKRRRSDGITKWIISTNVNYCGPLTPEIAIPSIDDRLDDDSFITYKSDHSYSVDLWDPNYTSTADLSSTDSRMLVTIIWTFIYLYDSVAELDSRFTHFQICSDRENRLCFVLWGDCIHWYTVAQCRATICDLLNALDWHQGQARYVTREAPESTSHT